METIKAGDIFILSLGAQDDYAIRFAYIALEDIDNLDAVFSDCPTRDRAEIVSAYLGKTNKAKPIAIKELWLGDSYYYTSTRYSISTLGGEGWATE